LIFFLIVLASYWLIPQYRWQNMLLFIASVIFYSWLSFWHGVFLFVSISLNYLMGLGMERWKQRVGAFMWLGILFNLGFLVSIKYFSLYDEPLSIWINRIGLSGDFLLYKIILPLGVSFYTLKEISYLIDIRKGTFQASHDFVAFAAYISFFPQVFSGPIDRPQKLLKQLEISRTWSSIHVYNAWQLILMGLFKKIVIANTVKVFVDQIFLMQEPSKVFLIVGGLGFTLQIFADFSSYTDLARGFSFLLGLNTTENFNKPYLSLSPTEFWNRWHISFSSWLRDYVFFPVRRWMMQKHVPEIFSEAIPPVVTMLLSGLWHGTGYTFIVWGLYYGVLIVVYQWFGIRGEWKLASLFKRFLAWLVMFSFIVFGWILFRAQSLPWIWQAMTVAPFSHGAEELTASFVILMMIAFYALLLFAKHLLNQYVPEKINLHALYYTAAVALAIVFMNSSSPDFIYFQF
jgi:D-alanyl-lipoteichoic acid acyltransferase DltB (MBOAT superfamily)